MRWQDQAIVLSYTQASQLKVISMIYAPPYLLRRRFRRCSRSQLASSPRVTAEHTRSKHWKSNRRTCIYYYEAITRKQEHEGNTRRRTTISHLPSRAVTNRLSEVSVTHDVTSRLASVQVVQLHIMSKVVNMASHTSMAYHTIMARGEA